MKTVYDARKLLLFIGITMLLCIIAVTAYFSLRKTFARFSLDFAYPFVKLAKTAENEAAIKSMAALKTKNELAEMVVSLTRENARIMAENAARTSLEQDNANLRALLSMKSISDYKAIYSEVIVRDPVKWLDSFTIDSGSYDGIEEGDCVLAPYIKPDGTSELALIGRIRLVSDHSSVVSTLFRDDCKVGVVLEDASAHGILSGASRSKQGAVRVTFLPADGKYSSGDRVITSGASLNIPYGITAGVTLPTSEGYAAVFNDTRLYAETQFVPAVKIDSVRFVIVLTRHSKENVSTP